MTHEFYKNKLNNIQIQIEHLHAERKQLEFEYTEENKALQKGQKVRAKCTEISADGRKETIETAVCTGNARVDKEGDIWYEMEFEDGYLTELRIDFLEVVS